MSLDVAIQSVVFYILSCSTCSKISHRRKAKAAAKRERAEKLDLEMEQPGLYRHPSPFSTNPYWTEEIMMGPGPPKKNGDKGSSKNASQRALNTAGQGSSYAGSTAVSTDPASSPTVATEGSRISGDGWNRKRYQREDEALWGLDLQGPGQRLMDAIAKAGSSASRMLESRLSKSEPPKEDEGTYYTTRNPPVNDLHPPVVSSAPANRDETRWMLQPPPAAKVMEGKERVNRNRADSNGSSRRGGDATPLSRKLTGKLVDAKLQRGEVPYVEGHSLSSRTEQKGRTPTFGGPRSQRHERNRSSSRESSSSSDGMRRKRKPPPISTISISTSARHSQDTIEHIPIASNSTVVSNGPSAAFDTRERPARPLLATIVSSSNLIPQVPKEDDDKQALRELAPGTTSSALNSRAPSPCPRPLPSTSSRPISIPSMDSKFPGSPTFCFPRATSENEDPATQHT